MAEKKEIHLRLDQSLYREFNLIAAKSSQTLQEYLVESGLRCLVEPKQSKNSNYTFIDLFAGIGGMRLGFEQAGAKCVYSSEWNKYSQKTYLANFGERPEGDITQVKAEDIPDHDILVAGFPCQPFSLAGVSKKNSLGRPTGFEDKTQGTLFFDVCRILKAKRPAAFLLENVKNLKSHDRGNTFKVIQESLNDLEYDIFYRVIDGQWFVPQHRERILIVGFDRKRYGHVRFNFDLEIPEVKPVLADILEENVDDKYTLSDRLWTYLQEYAAKHRKAGNGFGYGIANPNGATRTLSARYYKDGSEILIAQSDKNPRRLTPRECARLQGFPDDFKIVVSDVQAYKQFGNSVVVPLIQAVAEILISKLQKLDQQKEAGELPRESASRPVYKQLFLDLGDSEPFDYQDTDKDKSVS